MCRNQWGIRSLENYILEELMNYNSVLHSQSHCASFSLMELNWFSIDRVLLKMQSCFCSDKKINVTCFSDEAYSIMKHVRRKILEKNLSAMLTCCSALKSVLNLWIEIVINLLVLFLFKEKNDSQLIRIT